MKEVWKPVKDYEDYLEVSNLGRVKSVARRVEYSDGRVYNYPSKLKKLTKGNHGYLKVSLVDKSNRLNKSLLVHRLVAQTFIPNPENKETVNHKDGVKWNNKVENLEWNTSAENNRHAYDTELNDIKGQNNGNSKLREKDIVFIRSSNLKQRELIDMFNVSSGTISQIINRKAWKHI